MLSEGMSALQHRKKSDEIKDNLSARSRFEGTAIHLCLTSRKTKQDHKLSQVTYLNAKILSLCNYFLAVQIRQHFIWLSQELR